MPARTPTKSTRRGPPSSAQKPARPAATACVGKTSTKARGILKSLVEASTRESERKMEKQEPRVCAHTCISTIMTNYNECECKDRHQIRIQSVLAPHAILLFFFLFKTSSNLRLPKSQLSATAAPVLLTLNRELFSFKNSICSSCTVIFDKLQPRALFELCIVIFFTLLFKIPDGKSYRLYVVRVDLRS